VKTVGLMTLLSVAVTAAAPDREPGKAATVVESRVAQDPVDCIAKTRTRGPIAPSGDRAVGKGARQCRR
jgi:hypothetical protein